MNPKFQKIGMILALVILVLVFIFVVYPKYFDNDGSKGNGNGNGVPNNGGNENGSNGNGHENNNGNGNNGGNEMNSINGGTDSDGSGVNTGLPASQFDGFSIKSGNTCTSPLNTKFPNTTLSECAQTCSVIPTDKCSAFSYTNTDQMCELYGSCTVDTTAMAAGYDVYIRD